MKNIYKTIFLLILQSSIFNFQSYSQTAPAIEWQNTIGGSGDEWFFAIQQTDDGGYILGGWSGSNISGDKTENAIGLVDYWIVKTDASGVIQWQNTIGGNDSDVLRSIQQTTDKGYILGGRSASNISGDKTENSNGGNDYWIVKTDSSGNIQWQNTIGGSGYEDLYSIQQTTDGGYILGGSSTSDISGDKTEYSNGGNDYWIVKTDSSGNIQWQNAIGGSSNDYLLSIQQTSDGGYILGGYSESNISGDKTENSNGGKDYWIIKTDAAGIIQWQNTIGGNDIDELHSVQQVTDGSYIFGGYSSSAISGDKTENSNGYWDYWVVKTDTAGTIQWQNTIGGNNFDYFSCIRQTVDGGHILAGYSFSNISGDKTENNIDTTLNTSDYWVVKTDAAGNIQWQNTIGGNKGDVLASIRQTTDGGYILGGYSYSNLSGDKTENSWNNSYDYWIIKLFPDTITGIADFGLEIADINVFPNPLTSQSKITFNNPNKEKFVFTLYDITGRLCDASPLERGQGCVITTDDKIILEKGNKQAGIYLFNLTNKKTGERMNGKIVVSDE